MSERDGFQSGVPCWVDTLQPDPGAAAAFYGELFGWEAAASLPAEAPAAGLPAEYRLCRLRGRDVAAIGSQPSGASQRAPVWGTYVWVDDPEETASRAAEAGGRVLFEPFDSLDGGRMAVIADPGGAVLGVWRPGEHRGAQLVNEPGAWSMSALNSRDPDGAKASTAQCSAGRPRRSSWAEPRRPCGACPASSAASPSSRSPGTWSPR